MKVKLPNLEQSGKCKQGRAGFHICFFILLQMPAFIYASEANDYKNTLHKVLAASGKEKQQRSNPISFQFKDDSWSVLGFDTGSLPKSKFLFENLIPEINVPYYQKNMVGINLDASKQRGSARILSISAAKGEIEPFSIMLTTSSDLVKDVRLSAINFVDNESKNKITKDSIDIKIVKKWYQSGRTEKRSASGKKYLVEELLLNDDSLVRIDTENEINVVRNLVAVEDSTELIPFDIDGNQEKKIWLNIHVPPSTAAGLYKGKININYRLGNRRFTKLVPVEIKVHNFLLEDSLMPYCLYYFGSRSVSPAGNIDSNYRSYQQMLNDFSMIKSQGFSTVVLIHEYNSGLGRPLDDVMKAMKKNGLGMYYFIYRDLFFEKAGDNTAYRKKLGKIKSKIDQYRFNNVYLYNQDEKSLKEIEHFKDTLLIAKELGFRNAITIPVNYLKHLPSIDLAITRRNKKISKSSHSSKSEIWAYHFPQAGIEAPERYQMDYGRTLVMDGFDGSCNFAFQTQHAGKSSWDDWSNNKFRPHNMAYPTLSGNIRTLQLEGYREGIDDVRYASTLVKFIEMKNGRMTRQEKLEALRRVVKKAAESPTYRGYIVERIANLQKE